MNADGMWIAVASGAVGAGTIILPTLAIALAYAHGRYIPIWLLDLGTVGAYSARLLWSYHLPAVAAIGAVLVVAVLLGWAIHGSLVVRFIDNHDYLSPLLIGLGLAFAFQGVASLMGSGLSEHFPANLLQHHRYVEVVGFAIHASDIAGILVGCVVISSLSVLLRGTNLGIKVRAAMDNRDWARSLGLPVVCIDRVVVGTAVVLSVGGACVYGNRYDLQPTMMFFPGLTAIAAGVTAGMRRPFLAVPLACGVIIVETAFGLSPSLGYLQRAAPFVLLVVVLIVRSLRPKVSEEAVA